MELGLVVHGRKTSSSGATNRSKADIVADYRQKLDELQRSTGSVGPLPSAANGPATLSSSAVVSEASGATGQGSTHDFVSIGSVSASALSCGTGGLAACGFSIQSGPCQRPDEDASSAPCTKTTEFRACGTSGDPSEICSGRRFGDGGQR